MKLLRRALPGDDSPGQSCFPPQRHTGAALGWGSQPPSRARSENEVSARRVTSLWFLRLLIFFYLPVVGLGSGCASTKLSIPPPEAAIERLAGLAPRGVRLAVAAPITPVQLGHQYLLVVIPFGSIALIDPQTSLRRALSTELAIGGVRTVPEGSSSPAPLVTVTPIELSVTAYDLLLVRRVTAAAHFAVSVAFPDRTEPELHFEASGESSSFERFGFAPELSQALGEALTQAGRTLVTTLQSSRRFRYDRLDVTKGAEQAPRPSLRRAL